MKPASNPIWRYMSVAELISILDTRALIFRQFRSLRQDDRAEGAIPKDLYEGDSILGKDPMAMKMGLTANIDLQYCTYVQCWHRSIREHSAFWKIYGNRGVAIRTSITALMKERFWNGLTADDIIYANTWEEIRAKGLNVPPGITPNRTSMRRKRRVFSWEREWRVFFSPPTAKYGPTRSGIQGKEEWRRRWPKHEKVEIGSLEWITRVVVAPASPDWVVDAIRTIADRNGIRCDASKI